MTTGLTGFLGRIEELARRAPDRPALLAPGRAPHPYGLLRETVHQGAAALRAAGLGRGDRVALVLPGGPELATALLAVAAAATCAPLDPAYREDEFARYLGDLRVKALVTSPMSPEAAKRAAVALRIALVEIIARPEDPAGVFSLGGRILPARSTWTWPEPDDVAMVLHTSGSTARPKAVPLSHRNLGASAASIAGMLGLRTEDRCLNMMPLFHVHGLVGSLLATLVSGGSVVCAPGPDPSSVLAWVGAFRPTWYSAVPAMHQMIAAAARRAPGVAAAARFRFIRSSSAPLASSLAGELEQLFGCPVIEAYGMTEASHQIASNPLPPEERRAGSVGRATGVAVRVVDDAGRPRPVGAPGEILVSGATIASGYANDPEASAAAFRDGWLRTGDRGYLDGDGYLYLTGRASEIVNRGGAKVSPREVDDVLLAHPAVAQAVAFAVPHPTLGEDLAVAVVLRPDAAVTEGELRAYAADRLAPFKVPGQVVFVRDIPAEATGKIKRTGLAETLAGVLHPAAVPPEDPTERLVAGVWQDVLGVGPVGRHDNFFRLGGDSIRAAQVVARLATAHGGGLAINTVFAQPTVAGLAAAVERAQRVREAEGSGRSGPAGPLALSPSQRRQWFLEQLSGDSAVHNVSGALRLSGPLDAAALERALDQVVARHDTLRTTFRQIDGEPVQTVAPASGASLEVVRVASEQEARERCGEMAHRPFDLAAAPPWRLVLFRLGPADHVLLLVMHHIASDVWSRRILLRDLATAYGAARAAREPAWRPLAEQYPALAARQAAEADGAALREQLEYWTATLRGAPESLDLPTDRTRPAVPTGRGAEVRTVIPAETVGALERLAREEGATLFMALAAGFAAVLARHAGQDLLVLGTPVAGRPRQEMEELIGFLVNTLALRIDLSGRPTFRELLRRVRDTALAAYAHQDVPFERVVEAVRPVRDTSHTPVFQVVLAFHNVPAHRPVFAGIEAAPFDVESRVAPFDLYVTFVPDGPRLNGFLRYSTDLWDRETMDRLLGAHLGRLLMDAGRRPDVPWAALELVGPEERRLVVEEWNRTGAPYPRDATVPGLIAAHAARAPDAVAIEMGPARVTYGELAARAALIAGALEGRGVKPEVPVGIAADRSPDTIVALLGILWAGGAYVPLDAEDPRERLHLLLRDTGAPLVLAASGRAARFADLGVPVLTLEQAESAGASADGPARVLAGPDTLAYVIYTSGSTGEPKGVEVTHRAILRLVCGQTYARFGPDEVFLHASPLSFDASTFEIWGALSHGGRVVVHPDRVPTATGLAGVIRDHGVTTAWLSAQLFNAIVDDDAGALGGLRRLLVGGQALSPAHVRRALAALPGTQLVNGYGPTECTTFACCYPIPRELPDAAPSVPIGPPIANTRAYILDGDGAPVPIGLPGELHLGGDGVARGYRGRPHLTAERFIPDPFGGAPGARLYRTGDACRWRPDGAIEFLGRLDRQVKLRGFRIEPGEIEAVLRAGPGVAEAVVVLREDHPGDARLVAYVVPDPDEVPAVEDLRVRVRQRLPGYMHPSLYVYLEALPISASGKLDARALPPPGPLEPAGPLVRPADALELQLVTIWERVLGVSPISVEASFFDLGGHSLLSLKLFAEIERQVGRRLPLATLFRLPTVRALAGALRDPQWAPDRSPIVPIRPDGARIPFFCVHGLGGNVVSQRDLARLLGDDQPFYGLQAAALHERPARFRSLEDIAAGYVAGVRSIRPEGPYALGGICFGGLVAFEMARQLAAAGQVVGLLALIDPPAPAGPGGLRKRALRAVSRTLRRLGLWRRRSRVERAGVRRVHGRAIAQYRARPYPGSGVLFATTRQHRGHDASARHAAWARLVTGGLECHVLEGHHRLIVVEPMVRTVATRIRERLGALTRG